MITVQLGDEVQGNVFRASRRAFSVISAVSESRIIHGFHHGENPLVLFRLALGEKIEMARLGRSEKHGRSVFAGCNAGAASDACRRIHCLIGIFLGYRQGIPVRSATGTNGDEPSGLGNAIESRTVHDQVSNNRKGSSPKGLDRNRITILELSHVQLTSRSGIFRAVRQTIDRKRTGSADSFPAVMVENDRFDPLSEQLFVELIQHFKKRGILGYFVQLMDFKPTGVLRVFLPPNSEYKSHWNFVICSCEPPV